MSEWFKELVLKTSVGRLTVGSNPTPSAKKKNSPIKGEFFFLLNVRDSNPRRSVKGRRPHPTPSAWWWFLVQLKNDCPLAVSYGITTHLNTIRNIHVHFAAHTHAIPLLNNDPFVSDQIILFCVAA